MAEESFGERTERATPRRRQEARRDGQVARSAELTGAIALLAALLALVAFGPGMLQNLGDLMRAGLVDRGDSIETTQGALSVLHHVGGRLLWILTPLLASLMAIGLLVNILQVGFLFTTKPLMPQLSKLDPIKGFTRLFGRRGFVELLKAIAKVSAVGIVAFFTVRSDIESLVPLVGVDGSALLHEMGRSTLRIGLRAGAVLLVLAALDYAYQKWEYEKSLRMSPKEIEEEQKQTEGDPRTRARIRALQRAAARRRMMRDVPTADVVVTNPVHVAVALKYDRARMNAPVVVARGMRKVAQRIKEIAKEHGVPIVEDPPLARTLHRETRVGEAIPASLYQAVAQLLAQIWRLQQASRRGLGAAAAGVAGAGSPAGSAAGPATAASASGAGSVR